MDLSNNKMLYRNIILNNYENPNNKIEKDLNDNSYLLSAYKSATCIDNYKLYVKFENDTIIDAKFCGLGCAISTASLNIFCNLLKNKSIEVANQIIDNYENMIYEKPYDKDILEDLICFHNISSQHNRIPCASICYKAFLDCIQRYLNEKQ